MSTLTVREALAGLGQRVERPFTKLDEFGYPRLVLRPVGPLSAGGGLGGELPALGLTMLPPPGRTAPTSSPPQESACGPKPGITANETAVCCPSIGWVIYDSLPFGTNACEAASGGGSGSSGGGSSSGSDLPTDPDARVEELRRRIDERRASAEEREFEQRKTEIQLRFTLGRIQAIQAQEAAAARARASAEAARLKAEREAREQRERMELLKNLALGAGVVFLVSRVLR